MHREYEAVKNKIENTENRLSVYWTKREMRERERNEREREDILIKLMQSESSIALI